MQSLWGCVKKKKPMKWCTTGGPVLHLGRCCGTPLSRGTCWRRSRTQGCGCYTPSINAVAIPSCYGAPPPPPKKPELFAAIWHPQSVVESCPSTNTHVWKANGWCFSAPLSAPIDCDQPSANIARSFQCAKAWRRADGGGSVLYNHASKNIR